MKDFLNRVLVAIIGLSSLFIFDKYFSIYYGWLFIILRAALNIEVIKSLNSNYKTKQFFFTAAAGIFYSILGTSSLQTIIDCKLFWQFLISVFIVDSSAYVFGKLIKGPKLAPNISPNKTISGALFATIIGSICFKIFILNSFVIPIYNQIAFSILFSITTQLGDLLISWTKRQLKVKNSSNLLGSHGGLWDRCDSIFAGAIFLKFIILSQFVIII